MIKTCNKNNSKPWSRLPSQLIEYGLVHLNMEEDDFNKYVSFLFLDVGIETLLKTFLALSNDQIEEIIKKKPNSSFSDRRKAIESRGFGYLVEELKKLNINQLIDDDLDIITYYHSTRNQLYHQGTGITPSIQDLRGYAEYSVILLNVLMDVNLESILNQKENEEKEKLVIAELEAALNKLKKKISDRVDKLIDFIIIRIEELEPTLVSPKFIKEVRDTIQVSIKEADFCETNITNELCDKLVQVFRQYSISQNVISILFDDYVRHELSEYAFTSPPDSLYSHLLTTLEPKYDPLSKILWFAKMFPNQYLYGDDQIRQMSQADMLKIVIEKGEEDLNEIDDFILKHNL